MPEPLSRSRVALRRTALAVEELEPRLVPALPRPAHVVVVIEENHSFDEIIGSPAAPYLNSLARQGALLTDASAVSHPSQPNYLALFSGSDQGVTDDSCVGGFAGANLASELAAAGRTFGGFSESLPYAGYAGCDQGPLYARRHNPWADFLNVPAADNLAFLPPAGRGARRSFAPSGGGFGALPTVSIVVPNLQNDMHDGTVQQGDTWLQANLAGYAHWARTHHSLLVVTWDEDDGTPNNHIATLVVGQGVRRGRYGEPVNHYNLLRTVEDMYGLAPLGASAAAAPITDIWGSTGRGASAHRPA
jgi:acid phosphatase